MIAGLLANRGMKWIWHFFAVVILGISTGGTAMASEWATAKEAAGAYFDKGQCNKAWVTLWPWAKNGHSEARYLIAGAVVFSGLAPPGADNFISFWRHRTILSIYGDEYEEGRARSPLPDASATRHYQSQWFPYAWALVAYHECREAGQQPKVCIAKFVKAKILPPFDDYARKIDAIQSAGLGGAVCGCDWGYGGFAPCRDPVLLGQKRSRSSGPTWGDGFGPRREGEVLDLLDELNELPLLKDR